MRKALILLLLFAAPALANKPKKSFHSHVGQVTSFPLRHPVKSGKAITHAAKKVGQIAW
jgi:hypothetical protein